MASKEWSGPKHVEGKPLLVGVSGCSLRKLNTLRLEQNRISGQLPVEWGAPDAFPALINLVLGNNALSGEKSYVATSTVLRLPACCAPS